MLCPLKRLKTLCAPKPPTVPSEPLHPILGARVAEWQARDDGSLGTLETALGVQYGRLLSEYNTQPVTMGSVKALVKGVQSLSRTHYISEAVEHWPTLTEVLDGNGDDCDGLELLAFWALRDSGETVRRAIYHNKVNKMGHMVTLWDHKGSTYVLDPTGAMSTRVNKTSWLRGWELLAEFTEDKGSPQ